MIRLFIENKEIEIDNSVQVAITKQFEDLTNPTVIINDWSKTVSIPFTVNNNNIFGHIYNPDKAVVDGGSIGVYFNPLKKLSFRIEWDNAILMTGYAKLNEVKQIDGKGSYDITLFGELGKVFQEMKKITFDTTTTDANYLINGTDYVDEYITKDLIYRTWTVSSQWQSTLQPKYYWQINQHGEREKVANLAYRVTDIIGFAPNNSFSEDFDYKTTQIDSGTSKQFTDILDESGFTEDTGVEPNTAIPNGLLPREYGEYRSYLQLPYIYWNKLFQLFKNKARTVTGYQFELDNSWFNDNNPYWYNLVYMLKPLSTIKNSTYNNRYSSKVQSPNVVSYDSSKKYHYDFSEYVPGMNWGIESEPIPMLINPEQAFPHYFHLTSAYVVDGQMNINFALEALCNLGTSKDIHIRNNAVFVVDVFMTDADSLGQGETSRIQLGRICAKWTDSSYVASNTTYTVNVPTTTIPSGTYKWTIFSGSYSFNIPSNMYDKDYKIGFSLGGWHAETAFSGSLFVDTNPSSVDLGDLTLFCGNGNALNLNVTPLKGKSFSNFTLNDLWNNDYNLFTEIIKYCKMYRIGITVDEFNKKINFKPFTSYFSNYTVKDWTNKVDKSKDFNIKPVTFENKYILFNYKETDTKISEDYKEKYGLNFGEYRLTTDYNFNSETTELFEDVTPSITNTDNVLSWNNLNTAHNITYSFPAEYYVYNKDKDNKEESVFGAFYFHNGLMNFSTEAALNLCDVYISDDTAFQQANNTYFYTGIQSEMQQALTYPKLDIVRDDNMCIFNVPKENYTYLNNYTGKDTIYTNFWQKYLDERYNVQNKMITCYVDLKPHEYNQFAFNHLVKVGNQLCMVNKIYDYDITANHTTKVDLITIQDIEGYTTDNY